MLAASMTPSRIGTFFTLNSNVISYCGCDSLFIHNGSSRTNHVLLPDDAPALRLSGGAAASRLGEGFKTLAAEVAAAPIILRMKSRRFRWLFAINVTLNSLFRQQGPVCSIL